MSIIAGNAIRVPFIMPILSYIFILVVSFLVHDYRIALLSAIFMFPLGFMFYELIQDYKNAVNFDTKGVIISLYRERFVKRKSNTDIDVKYSEFKRFYKFFNIYIFPYGNFGVIVPSPQGSSMKV